jgi:MFS family permease
VAIFPHTLKVLWAPIGDLTLSRKTWYIVALLTGALCLFTATTIPVNQSTVLLLSALVFAANLATTFLAFAVEGLMAFNAPDEKKGRAAGWFQAGNQIGQTLGGGIGLYLINHLPRTWMAGGVLVALLLACAFPLLLVQEPPPVRRELGIGDGLRRVGHELKELLSSRLGRIGALLAILPIGTAASQYLFSAVAGEWHASADTVAWVLGLGGGAAIALGCVLGGVITDRVPRHTAYAGAAAASLATALIMAATPRTPAAYAAATLLYIFVNGACQAALSGMIFGLIGTGATATKVNLYIALNTLGGLTAIRLVGAAHDRWQATGMLLFEVVLGVTALLIFAAVARTLLPARRAAVPGS